MDSVVVYSSFNSNRLQYVLGWLFTERLGVNYLHNPPDHLYPTTGNICVIHYGVAHPNTCSIPAADLLTSSSIERLSVTFGAKQWNGLPVLFANEGNDDYTLPFDLFAAIFYLISRYEEYLPYTPDKHNRYPAPASILFQAGLLRTPIVDQWVTEFANVLQSQFGLTLHRPPFTYQPTYDIDIAYSHAYKGAKRIVGAYVRALLKGDLAQIAERTKVLKKKQKDPYDSFLWLKQQHEAGGYRPIYFILCAQKTTPFDKNIHPAHPAMVRVMKQLSKEGKIGVHPSYYATTVGSVQAEKQILQTTIGRDVVISRQHYIRLKLPDTCNTLLQCGITDDYSMGYGTHLGFRAGTGASFFWYNLAADCITNLRIHPFCFMDATAHYEAALSPPEAFEQLHEMHYLLQQAGSTLVTVFHNFSLGTAKEWAGWSNHYAKFLQPTEQK